MESKNYNKLVNRTKKGSRLTDAENKVVVTTGEREGSRGNGRVGGKRGLI